MFKKISVVVVFIVELFVEKQWFLCRQFKDFIHLASTNQSLSLVGLIHNDQGQSLFIVRLFHNKVGVFLDLFFRYYLKFWDDRFLLNLLSVVGFIGIVLGIWYLMAGNFKNKKYLWVFFIFLLVLPLVEIIFQPIVSFEYKIILLTLPFQIFSLFGIWQFLGKSRNNLRVLLIISLIFLSIWWMSILNPDIYLYCVK